MAALEDDFEDLAYEDAEGAAALEDDFAAEDYGNGFEDDGFDALEAEGLEDEDMLYEDDAFDSFEADGFDAYDAFEDDFESEDALDGAMAYALSADEADEFFGKLVKGLKSVGKRVVSGIKKAAPVVGRIAGGVSKVASLIPHPYAQAVGKVAGVVGKAAQLAQRLRAEGASEDEALEAFAEMAARDPRALPLVAGLSARSVLKSNGASMSHAARKNVVKQMKGAAQTLVRQRGPTAIRALPKIVKSVKRTAAIKGTPRTAAAQVVRRTAAKVAASPGLVRKLARPSPAGVRLVRTLGHNGTATRSFVIPGPARISISVA